MKIPRILHRIYAGLTGYFWLPCPICKEYFGGHEKNSGSLYSDRYSGRTVCSNCVGEADKRNDELFKSLPPEIIYVDR